MTAHHLGAIILIGAYLAGVAVFLPDAAGDVAVIGAMLAGCVGLIAAFGERVQA